MTTRIGFLACAETIPGAGERRGDAFEHDLMVAALRPAFSARGMELVEIDWRSPLEQFDGLALVLLGSSWDYQDRKDEFLTRLDALAARGIVVCNPPEVVRWNIDKSYLRELTQRGAPTVPTLWHEDAGRGEVLAAFDHFGATRVVVKRQVGAGGMGQFTFTRDAPPDADWRMGRAAMIQPFLPAIVEEGEFTFFFVDGAFSHAVQKLAAPGEYRIQSLYGGTERDYSPPPAERAAAEAVIAALPFPAPLYCRVDMIRLPTTGLRPGALAVMEVEMVEPYYYPVQGPNVGARLADGVVRRLRHP